MPNVTNAQRQHLRRLAHELRPVVQIGKQGLTSSAHHAIDQALAAHELIKIKFLDFQDQKESLTDELVRVSESVLIGLVGNVATVYREHPDPEKRRIELPA